MNSEDIKNFYKKNNILVDEYDFENSPDPFNYPPTGCRYDDKLEL